MSPSSEQPVSVFSKKKTDARIKELSEAESLKIVRETKPLEINGK